MEGVECAWTRRGMMHVYERGGVCVHANSAPNHLTLSFLCRIVSGSQDYAYPNSRGHNIKFCKAASINLLSSLAYHSRITDC